MWPISRITHTAWRQRGAELLDKIGPAIIMTHSAGGPFGYLVADVRPTLVKGIVVVEGAGTPFGKGPQASKWGITTIPMTYDPAVKDPSELKAKEMPSPEPGVGAYQIQEEPAHKLKNLKGIPIVLVTSEASFASPGAPGALAFLKQAGCTAEELRLAQHGVHGNGHMMMVEKNNREVLQPILDWMDKNVAPHAKPTPTIKNPDAVALKLSEQGHFWVGTEVKKMPYGNIVAGQMYVQYLFPAQVRHPISSGVGAWRRWPGHALYGAWEREAGLGSLLFAGRLQGLSGRSPGSRASALSSGRARRHRAAADVRHSHRRFHARG